MLDLYHIIKSFDLKNIHTHQKPLIPTLMPVFDYKIGFMNSLQTHTN